MTMKLKHLLTGALCVSMAGLVPVALAGGSVLRADQDAAVAIDEANFPDDLFRDYVSTNFDKNNDGALSSDEISKVTEIDTGKDFSIYSLKGIEYFTELKSLIADEANLSEVDVSANTNLTFLSLMHADITELDISKNTELTDLNVNTCNLKSIDLSQNTKLKMLDIGFNENLSALDVSANTQLQSLYLMGNKVESLDLSANTELVYLDIMDTKITSLDLSKMKELNRFSGSETLTNLVLPESSENLISLSLPSAQISSINVSKYPNLDSLDISGTKITSLDVSANTKLTYLNLFNTGVTSIDLSKNLDLLSLEVGKTQISSLNICQNTKLKTLGVADSKLKEVDISNCPNLVEAIAKGEYTELNSSAFMYCFTFPNRETYYLLTSSKAIKLIYPEIETIDNFIERLYTIALNRESEEAGKKYWVDSVKSGEKTGADCARFFLIDAEEFLNRGLKDEDFVESLYKIFFGRESDADGKAFWVGKLKDGAKRDEIIGGFIDSTEWCNICAKYGVQSGAPTAKSEVFSNQASRFTKRLYEVCLTRYADDEGHNYWALALTNRDITGAEAACWFFNSEEYTKEFNSHTSKEDMTLAYSYYVFDLYVAFMDREPDDKETKYWVDRLNKGESRQSVLAFFAQSEEFTNVCKSYAIERGSI